MTEKLAHKIFMGFEKVPFNKNEFSYDTRLYSSWFGGYRIGWNACC